ncbi:hypothetical protein LZ554_009178 [Drepanopeziza brunnea f. sp. 'monogermtubi']|nr:hypothetical protein LZ554_009178 [Drepanopeziza brunnea f. sp. 'monogermtubi']
MEQPQATHAYQADASVAQGEDKSPEPEIATTFNGIISMLIDTSISKPIDSILSGPPVRITGSSPQTEDSSKASASTSNSMLPTRLAAPKSMYPLNALSLRVRRLLNQLPRLHIDKSVPVKAFPLFEKLPIELRLMIWEICAYTPRTVKVTQDMTFMISQSETGPFLTAMQGESEHPAVLQINRESRAQALKFYTKYVRGAADIQTEALLVAKRRIIPRSTSEVNLGHGALFINFSVDRFHIVRSSHQFGTHGIHSFNREAITQVQYISLFAIPYFYQRWEYTKALDLLNAVHRNASAKEITIDLHNAWDHYQPELRWDCIARCVAWEDVRLRFLEDMRLHCHVPDSWVRSINPVDLVGGALDDEEAKANWSARMERVEKIVAEQAKVEAENAEVYRLWLVDWANFYEQMEAEDAEWRRLRAENAEV